MTGEFGGRDRIPTCVLRVTTRCSSALSYTFQRVRSPGSHTAVGTSWGSALVRPQSPGDCFVYGVWPRILCFMTSSPYCQVDTRSPGWQIQIRPGACITGACGLRLRRLTQAAGRQASPRLGPGGWFVFNSSLLLYPLPSACDNTMMPTLAESAGVAGRKWLKRPSMV